MAAFVARPHPPCAMPFRHLFLPGRSASFSVSRELLSGFWVQRGASLLPLEAHFERRSDPGRWTTV
eukprot:2215846-Pyramimonas_sp.AAC.1